MILRARCQKSRIVVTELQACTKRATTDGQRSYCLYGWRDNFTLKKCKLPRNTTNLHSLKTAGQHHQSSIHRESKKGCHPNHGYNFVNSWSICKILSLLQTAVNFQQNSYWVTHHTLSMLLHYIGKLKNQKFALCMHVKHVSSVIFYHLSNRYLPNVMKISAKINTVKNNNILLFVRLLSLTNWRNA